MTQRTRGWILLALGALVAVGFLWIRPGQGNAAEQAAGQANDVAAELTSAFSATSGRPTPKVELMYVGQDRAPGWCFKVTYGEAGQATVAKRSCPDGPGPVDAPG